MFNQVGAVTSQAQLADRVAIQEVQALHSRGLDRSDAALLKLCYWQDAEVDYGGYKGPAHQFADIIMPTLESMYELTRHCIGNSIVLFESDTLAKSELCVNADHLHLGAKQEMQFAGRYLDTLEKRDGRWKILHRQVVIDWSRDISADDQREGEAFVALTNGAHKESDRSHAFFSNSGK